MFYLKSYLSCYFDEKHILKFFPLSSCQYVSTIPGKKTACYRPFKNGHFVWACMEKMMDHQYKESGERNIYSSYNQMRAYVESDESLCWMLSKSIKKLCLIDLSIEHSTKLWRFRKSTGHFCIWILPEYCSSALPAYAYEIITTTICVQIDTTVSVIRKSLSISACR